MVCYIVDKLCEKFWVYDIYVNKIVCVNCYEFYFEKDLMKVIFEK